MAHQPSTVTLGYLTKDMHSSTPLLKRQNTKTSFRDRGVGMGEGALHPQGPDPEARRPRPANRQPANKSAVENWTVRNRQE